MMKRKIGFGSDTGEFHYVADLLRARNRIEAERYISDRSRFAYIGGHRGIAIVLGKYKMYLDTEDQGFTPHMMFEGYWEYWLTRFLVDHIKPGDVVCDIGANLGYYSILMSELVGPGGTVHCFEPNPAICSLLASSLQINGFASRTVVHDAAVVEGDEAQVHFFVPAHEPKNAAIVGDAQERPGGAVLSAKAVNLNTLGLERLDFVKIDVEGGEMGVLRSLRALKARHAPKIVSEVNFARGYGYDDIVELLGYRGGLLHIDFHGNVETLTRDMALGQRAGEDWLVYWPGE